MSHALALSQPWSEVPELCVASGLGEAAPGSSRRVPLPLAPSDYSLVVTPEVGPLEQRILEARAQFTQFRLEEPPPLTQALDLRPQATRRVTGVPVRRSPAAFRFVDDESELDAED